LLSLAAVLIRASPIFAVDAQLANSDAVTQFDIPSQPLAAALRSYGKATGLELFYDGSLSIGHRSTAIRGSFTPMLALKGLLRGTGYVARSTELANTVTIVEAPPVAALRSAFEPFQPYFAVLQARLGTTLCDVADAASADQDITLRFWLDPSGVISHIELSGTGTNEHRQRAFAAKLEGLGIGMAPPPGLPQPITMVVYPASGGAAGGCPAASSRRAGN
jgi:hypothetical protein